MIEPAKTETNEIPSDTRAPCTRPESKSAPSGSVPNQWPLVKIGALRLSKSKLFQAGNGKRSPKTAAKRHNDSHPVERINPRGRRRRLATGAPHAWINDGIQHIDDLVEKDERHSDECDERLNRQVLTRHDRRIEQHAKSVERKNNLDDDCTTDEPTHLQRSGGHQCGT